MNKHEIDAVSVATGVAAVGLAAWWLLDQFIDIRRPDAGWFVAGALLLLGVLGLIAAIGSDRRRPSGDAPPEL
jgi:hypothetical protein